MNNNNSNNNNNYYFIIIIIVIVVIINMVCKDVVTEPVFQDVEREQLTRGSYKAQDARLDVHARGFWELQRSAILAVRVCHPNADRKETQGAHITKVLFSEALQKSAVQCKLTHER